MITVLTSTLNRSHTLPRLFESLCNQGYKHFEWVVVDGGSTDDSLALLAEFKEFFEYCNRQCGFANIKSISIENKSIHNLLLCVDILVSISFRS